MVKDIVHKAIAEHVPVSTAVEIFVPEHTEHGDYSTNVAFALAKAEGKSPRDSALALQAKLEESAKGVFSKIEVAGGGFLNVWLTDTVIQNALREAVARPDAWGTSDVGKGETVMVEYFQLNVAKIPHVGHLRSAVIGDALKRIFTALGYHAISDTHVGDWGTQFGILLLGYKSLAEHERAAIERDPLNGLSALYVATNARIDADPTLRDSAKEAFAKLERGDAENRTLWEWMVTVSMQKLEENRALLGLLLFDEHRGESSYEADMPPIVRDALARNIATKKIDGAVIVDLTAEGLDEAVLTKSDGASTYLLRDLATIRYRREHWYFAKNLYVVDVRQAHHFQQVFRVAELLGFEGVGESVHVSFGFMSLPEGAMSTRAGNVVSLTDVVAETIARARAIISEKNPTLPNADAVARTIGIGALKYFDLSHHRASDIVFDRDASLSFEGNTGPYLQYTYARLTGIATKAGKATEADIQSGVWDESERAFAAHIIQFPDAVTSVLDGYAPSVLARYLFELAQRANRFYHTHPVSQAGDEATLKRRRALVKAAATTLSRGLFLIGIEAPKEM